MAAVWPGAVEVGVDEFEETFAQECPGIGCRPRAEHLCLGLEGVDELVAGAYADIGGEQQILDLLPCLVVERVAREKRQQPSTEGGFRPRKPCAQPDEPTGRRFGSFGEVGPDECFGGVDRRLGRWRDRSSRSGSSLGPDLGRAARQLGSRRPNRPPTGAAHEESAARPHEDDDRDQDLQQRLHGAKSRIGSRSPRLRRSPARRSPCG